MVSIATVSYTHLHPAMYEVKKVYQSFQMTAKDLEAGVITIDNEYIDTNANEYDMTWELIRDGKPVAHNTQSVDVPPQETVDITLEGYTAPAKDVYKRQSLYHRPFGGWCELDDRSGPYGWQRGFDFDQ